MSSSWIAYNKPTTFEHLCGHVDHNLSALMWKVKKPPTFFEAHLKAAFQLTTAKPPLPCLRHAAESGRHHHKPNLHTYFPGERRWVKQMGAGRSFATVWSSWTDKDTHKHFSHSSNKSEQEQTASRWGRWRWCKGTWLYAGFNTACACVCVCMCVYVCVSPSLCLDTIVAPPPPPWLDVKFSSGGSFSGRSGRGGGLRFILWRQPREENRRWPRARWARTSRPEPDSSPSGCRSLWTGLRRRWVRELSFGKLPWVCLTSTLCARSSVISVVSHKTHLFKRVLSFSFYVPCYYKLIWTSLQRHSHTAVCRSRVWDVSKGGAASSRFRSTASPPKKTWTRSSFRGLV